MNNREPLLEREAVAQVQGKKSKNKAQTSLSIKLGASHQLPPDKLVKQYIVLGSNDPVRTSSR